MRGQTDQPESAGERSTHISDESGGDSAATTGDDSNSGKTAEGRIVVWRCFKCDKKGHRVTTAR